MKIDLVAIVPHERGETNVVELPPPPGYTTSAERTD